MQFNRHFTIAGREIGPGRPVYFIAEAGVNHFGDLGKALALVDLAADSGADAFKTQAFSTDTLVSARLPDWRERLRPKEVSFDFLERMAIRCQERGITFMCTAHDESVLPWLDRLGVPAFKIGSGERGNLPYFRRIAAYGKPVILSTGMNTADDIRAATTTFAEAGCRDLALLHCVTSYPTPYAEVNLRAMDELRRLHCGPVGYSDHTDGHHALIAAVALGAQILEKHITLDFNVPNAQDWKVSAGPDDLARLVRSVRETELALGTGEKLPQNCEAAAEGWAIKALVATADLAAGTVLSADMLIAKRAGAGIPPRDLAGVLGRTLALPLGKDDPLTPEHLK